MLYQFDKAVANLDGDKKVVSFDVKITAQDDLKTESDVGTYTVPVSGLKVEGAWSAGAVRNAVIAYVADQGICDAMKARVEAKLGAPSPGATFDI